jgi:hypothetical protein
MRAGGRGTGREMTSEPASARFDQRSLMGVSTSIGAAVLVGSVCAGLHAPPQVTGPLTAGAIYLPAAIEYSLKGRRRNVTADISRIRQGELRRPVALVLVMLVAALFLAEVIALTFDNGYPWIRALVAAPLAFFISWYASHYLGNHPYRWTVVAVGALFIIYLAFTIYLISSFETDRGWAWHVFPNFAHSSIVLNASLAGTWCGRRHHDKFLARKLARLERKAAKQAAKRPEPTLQRQATGTQASAQDSSAPQDLVPFAMNVATQPNGPSSSPHNLPTGDPLKQIEKLAQLRDTGALTEEEFQAKKTEILGRI